MPAFWKSLLRKVSGRKIAKEDGSGEKPPMTGQGTMNYPGGMKYIGEWREGRWEGQ
ncbi:MAG: hypothetical protein H6Q84_2967, partial [Deltaproteobacteria bacterium]|nr:hypothetical protein [Deltaproteobacteria bacterium]